ncbi:MAG: hypothetical protein KIG52_05710, partial [Muribaculaceae bacterium]|nr:hypothetical protein [Muribaculaceae bacterium]
KKNSIAHLFYTNKLHKGQIYKYFCKYNVILHIFYSENQLIIFAAASGVLAYVCKNTCYRPTVAINQPSHGFAYMAIAAAY